MNVSLAVHHHEFRPGSPLYAGKWQSLLTIEQQMAERGKAGKEGSIRPHRRWCRAQRRLQWPRVARRRRLLQRHHGHIQIQLHLRRLASNDLQINEPKVWPATTDPQCAGCCSCVPAPCMTPRLVFGGGHRRTSARKEPLEPSRWMTRPAKPRRGSVAAGSTCSLDSPLHAAIAALVLAFPLSCCRSRASTAAHGLGDWNPRTSFLF